MYRILVVEGAMDPLTLLEKLRPHEAIEHVTHLPYRDKEAWEQARLIAYVMAQVNSKDRITPQHIAEFPWDEKKVTEVTQEDRERLKKRAEQIAKKLYG